MTNSKVVKVSMVRVILKGFKFSDAAFGVLDVSHVHWYPDTDAIRETLSRNTEMYQRVDIDTVEFTVHASISKIPACYGSWVIDDFFMYEGISCGHHEVREVIRDNYDFEWEDWRWNAYAQSLM